MAKRSKAKPLFKARSKKTDQWVVSSNFEWLMENCKGDPEPCNRMARKAMSKIVKRMENGLS